MVTQFAAFRYVENTFMLATFLGLVTPFVTALVSAYCYPKTRVDCLMIALIFAYLAGIPMLAALLALVDRKSSETAAVMGFTWLACVSWIALPTYLLFFAKLLRSMIMESKQNNLAH